MSPHFEHLQKLLKQLPGLGYRSAERIALHLLVEHPERLAALQEALSEAATHIRRCPNCGNLCEGDLCEICRNPRRQAGHVCVVETVPDLLAIERSGAFDGHYHVLHGKLSPIQGIGPEDLNMARLGERLGEGGIEEVTLALSNDIEGEATCHYIEETLLRTRDIRVTRIGFGLPSGGGGLVFADASTLRNALDGRRAWNQSTHPPP